MATLEVRKHYYVIIFYSRNRKPTKRSLVFKKSQYTKRQVLEIKTELETRFKTGDFDPWHQTVNIEPSNDVLSLNDAILKYIEQKSSEDWGDRTVQPNKNILLQFSRLFPGIYVDQIKAEHINQFLNRKGIAYDTRVGNKRVLTAFVNRMTKDELIDKSAISTSDIKIFAKQKQKAGIRYVTEEEQRILSEYIYKKVRSDIKIGNQSLRLNSMWLIEFMKWQRYSGMRLSETLAIKVSDIDLETGRLTIRKTKAKKTQYLSIGEVPPLIKIAKRRVRATHDKSDLLFGKKSASHVIRLFRTYRNAALPDKKDITIHTFRHSCAIDLLRGGVDIYRVMRWL